MTENELLHEIWETYKNTGYPEGFTADYDIMECLADRNGIDTFLVQDHGGNRFIAKKGIARKHAHHEKRE